MITIHHYDNIIAHFEKKDPVIHQVLVDMDMSEWVVPRKEQHDTLGYFGSICRQIIGQQLSGNVAKVIIERFVDLLSETDSIASLQNDLVTSSELNPDSLPTNSAGRQKKGSISFTPQAVLSLSDQAMREVGMSWAKVSYVKNIARAFDEGQVDAIHLHSWTDEIVIEHLTQIKGVGRWTAEMFLMFTLGREDVFSFGDLGLKRGLEKLYGLDNPKKELIEKIVAPWSPYKSYGSFALWQSLE
jgi:3-methyladenine DNA glycosylase/8-oxoguanine DNA glycosylase